MQAPAMKIITATVPEAEVSLRGRRGIVVAGCVGGVRWVGGVWCGVGVFSTRRCRCRCRCGRSRRFERVYCLAEMATSSKTLLSRSRFSRSRIGEVRSQKSKVGSRSSKVGSEVEIKGKKSPGPETQRQTQIARQRRKRHTKTLQTPQARARRALIGTAKERLHLVWRSARATCCAARCVPTVCRACARVQAHPFPGIMAIGGGGWRFCISMSYCMSQLLRRKLLGFIQVRLLRCAGATFGSMLGWRRTLC
ncbi:hypothetical protein C7974DRAFT_393665, partial [Boeremia exigua]|uniref:uncharacterized protein n=1 Tax=Boeremia exigua TaxID=749465 RepID=UPI001E8D8B72